MKFSSIFLKLQLRRLKFPIKLISADILSQDFVLSWWISSNKTTSFFVFWMHSWNFCKLLILSRNKFFFRKHRTDSMWYWRKRHRRSILWDYQIWVRNESWMCCWYYYAQFFYCFVFFSRVLQIIYLCQLFSIKSASEIMTDQ